jgi:UDPglucose 6-dehydrogenase
LAIASEFGSDFPLIDAALESNAKTTTRVLDVVRDLAGGNFEGKVIGVWGLAFKANTDDLRESPSMKIVQDLLALGVMVQAYDPVAVAPEAHGFRQEPTAEGAARGADVLVILTEWEEFSEVDPATISSTMRGSAVLDTRRIANAEAWNAEFQSFRRLGGY